MVAQISDRLRLRAAVFVVLSTIAAAGYLMLALLDESHRNARYGALFLIHPGVLSAITVALGNVTDNCCGDIKKVFIRLPVSSIRD